MDKGEFSEFRSFIFDLARGEPAEWTGVMSWDRRCEMAVAWLLGKAVNGDPDATEIISDMALLAAWPAIVERFGGGSRCVRD